MSNDTKVGRAKGAPSSGKTDHERLRRMTEEEIERQAEEDPDAPLQSEEDLKRFKRVNPLKDK